VFFVAELPHRSLHLLGTTPNPDGDRRHCCIKAKDALAMPQRGEADPSGALGNRNNRASEGPVRRFLDGQ
jgi:hypothetical protein